MSYYTRFLSIKESPISVIILSGKEIKIMADYAWECGDYKEMINLMAELISRIAF